MKSSQKTGVEVVPEIMVPLVSMMKELEFVKARIAAVAKQVERETGVDFSLSGRHDDRIAARGHARRGHRRSVRIFLVRNQ